MSPSPLAFALATCLALSALTACTPSETTAPEPADTPAPTAPIVAALPSCDGPPPADNDSDRGTFDCSLTFDGNPPLTFTVR